MCFKNQFVFKMHCWRRSEVETIAQFLELGPLCTGRFNDLFCGWCWGATSELTITMPERNLNLPSGQAYILSFRW